jgi:two-component system sensor histidine kinase RegB
MRSAFDPLGRATALSTLVRFRWLAIGAQLIAVLVAHYGIGLPIELPWVALVLALAAVSNGALAAASLSGASENLVGPVLFLDTVLLTVLLHLSGDASNPFSIVYLVQVTLAAVRTRPRWTWAITGSSVLGYGTLFLRAPAPSAHGMHGMHHHAAHGAAHEEVFSAHLYGMWLAFAITAVLVAFFVSRVAQALEDERERADRAARLVSVSTLAAGAAHELSTPLGTIKLAAAELARAIDRGVSAPELADDAALIRAEVERMSAVLERLRSRSGERDGEAPTSFTLLALSSDVSEALEGTAIDLRTGEGAGELVLPRKGVLAAIVNLAKNALDASGGSAASAAAGKTVEIDLGMRGERLVVRVADRGTGIAPQIEAHLGEPFVTTKEPGHGMGLGLFLVRSLAEGLNGTFRLRAREGGGALAELELPRSVL